MWWVTVQVSERWERRGPLTQPTKRTAKNHPVGMTERGPEKQRSEVGRWDGDGQDEDWAVLAQLGTW